MSVVMKQDSKRIFLWSLTPSAAVTNEFLPETKHFPHVNINDLCDYLNVEIGASSTFYYGKIPYYHLNDHL